MARHEIDADLIEQIRAALEGDSNDALYDALAAVADALKIDWVAFDDGPFDDEI